MSKKQAKKPAPESNWREVAKPSTMCEGNRLIKRSTARPVVAKVRPGMIVSVQLADSDDDYAEVIAVLPDFCIAQGDSGMGYALHWHEVDVTVCGPDPDYLPAVPTRTRRPQRSSNTATAKKPKAATPPQTFPRVAA